MFGIAAFIAFLLTIPAANFFIGHVGSVCVPDGACLIPVGFGLMAPSGVLFAGLAFVLRDIVHRIFGVKLAFAAIALGTLVSAFIAPAALVVASAVAFFISELSDLAVYQPLHKRGFILAVAASSVVGLAVDSLLFLWIAFGSFDYIAGQIVGKTWMVALATLAVWVWSRRAAATAVTA